VLDLILILLHDGIVYQFCRFVTYNHRLVVKVLASNSSPQNYNDINDIYLQDKYNKSKENKSVLQIKMVGLKIPSAIIIFFYHCVIIIHADGKLDFPVFCVMLINWQCLLPLVSFVLNKHENKMSLAKLLNVITT
jgi:hypothetical protein